MDIQKYRAKIKGTDTVVIGYIVECREYLGDGTYGTGTDYLICVTDKSMPGGSYGNYLADKESVVPTNKKAL